MHACDIMLAHGGYSILHANYFIRSTPYYLSIGQQRSGWLGFSVDPVSKIQTDIERIRTDFQSSMTLHIIRTTSVGTERVVVGLGPCHTTLSYRCGETDQP